MERRTFLAAVGLGVSVVAGCTATDSQPAEASADQSDGDEGSYAVETVVDSFDSPWGLASVDGSRLLVTDPESGGLLVAVDGSDAPLVRTVPE